MSHLTIRVIVAALAGALLLVVGCKNSGSETYEPDSLIGTWEVVATGVTLTFESGSDGQVYKLRDPQGFYSNLLEGGSDLLVSGYWTMSGAFLFLDDETGPAACPSTSDRFVITMNDERTIMTLTHLGDECPLRADLLADHTWQLQPEGS